MEPKLRSQKSRVTNYNKSASGDFPISRRASLMIQNSKVISRAFAEARFAPTLTPSALSNVVLGGPPDYQALA
jgi:hypothetical protein